MSNVNELRKLSTEKLNKKLEDASKALFNLRFQKALQQLEEPLLIRKKRREIAKIMTLINEKQSEESK